MGRRRDFDGVLGHHSKFLMLYYAAVLKKKNGCRNPEYEYCYDCWQLKNNYKLLSILVIIYICNLELLFLKYMRFPYS